jgi:hypothetical protein
MIFGTVQKAFLFDVKWSMKVVSYIGHLAQDLKHFSTVQL